MSFSSHPILFSQLSQTISVFTAVPFSSDPIPSSSTISNYLSFRTSLILIPSHPLNYLKLSQFSHQCHSHPIPSPPALIERLLTISVQPSLAVWHIFTQSHVPQMLCSLNTYFHRVSKTYIYGVLAFQTAIHCFEFSSPPQLFWTFHLCFGIFGAFKSRMQPLL